MVLKTLIATAALGFAAMSAPASAAEIVSPCNKTTDLSVVALECAGWYAGNLLNNGQGGLNVDAQISALSTIGLTWEGDWAAVDLTKVNASGLNHNEFDFAGALNGDVWIGIHKGKGGKHGYEGTGFFRLKASDLDAVSLNLKGASSAVVYKQQAAVPEPGTWGLLIVGFAAVGAALRRTRNPARLRSA